MSRIRRTFGTLLLVTALGLASLQEGGAQQPPLREEVGLRGYVLAPDGMPVAAGNVLSSAQGQLYGASANLTSLLPATVSNAGGSQAHLNMQPFLTLSFCVALQGIFPSRN